MNELSEICRALEELSECTIIMHRRPDGDTVGSAAALGLCLKKIGKTVHFACSDPITPKYAYLVDFTDTVSKPCGSIITVDVAAPDMAGVFEEQARQADIVIDHHATNPLCGRFNLVRPEAAATGEIIYDIISKLMPPDKQMAEALYVAISTDTACFRHGNTTPQTHRVAAALMETGLDITELNRRLFVIQSRAAFAVRGGVMQTLELFANGRAAVITLSLQLMRECGATEDDVESIASLPLEIEGIAAAATLREIAPNRYKISVRSDGSVDSAALCKAYGGGGHKMAAGCSMPGSEKECRTVLAKKLCEALGAAWTD